MSSSLIAFREPELEFRYNQRVKDPRDGLALFGPYDADLPSHPTSLSYIVLGAPDGIADFAAWADMMNAPAIAAPDDNYRLWPPFPGFEAAFCAPWPTKPVWTYAIDKKELLEASRKRDKHERAFSVVEYYMEGLRRANKLDEKIAVAIIVAPDEVFTNCRPESVVSNPVGPVIPPQSCPFPQSRAA